jgi:hypothetical protein
MKRNPTILLSLIALVLFVSPLLAGNTPACNHGKGPAGCCAGKGVTMQVANIDKGVTITLTGENAEAVKSVQDHAAKCAKHECCPSSPQTQYACPMHPEVTSDKPGKCSKCGMNLDTKKGMRAGSCDKATCPMKDAKIQVTNNDQGAVITITSDNPETVAAIQKCVADCHGAKGAAHGHKAEAQTKAKADACGKCPMKADCTKQAAPEKEIK